MQCAPPACLQLGLPWDKLMACATGAQGEQLLESDARLLRAGVVPTYVPFQLPIEWLLSCHSELCVGTVMNMESSTASKACLLCGSTPNTCHQMPLFQ